jgi:hypothetical protein
MQQYSFPLDDRDFTAGVNPSISLQSVDEKGSTGTILATFPCPPNLTTGATGNYGSIDSGALNAALQQSDASDGVKDSKLVGFLTQTLGQSISETANAISPDGVKAATFNAKIIENKNTQTTFEGNTVRSFSFALTIVPKSSAESQQIKAMAENILKRTYAEPVNGGAGLRYPPTWKIWFMVDGDINENLPRYCSCYLTNFTHNFNTLANIYYNDGAPFNHELTFNFQETRILNRKDIDDLYSSGMCGDGDKQQNLLNVKKSNSDPTGNIRASTQQATSKLQSLQQKFGNASLPIPNMHPKIGNLFSKFF